MTAVSPTKNPLYRTSFVCMDELHPKSNQSSWSLRLAQEEQYPAQVEILTQITSTFQKFNRVHY